MARYAINHEGAQALNQLANELLINANNIIEANQRLEQVTLSNEAGLGIYGDEIISIIHRNRQILNTNRDDVINLAQQVKRQSQEIENLVAMGMGETGGATNGISSSNGVSKITNMATLNRVDYSNASGTYQNIRNSLDRSHVGYKNLVSCEKNRSTEEIVSRLAGGDETQGSCSSLAFAYAGNKAGYDVLDFRDGDSRKIFSSNSSIAMIANLPGVDSKVVSGRDDVLCADQLLSLMQPDKEYYLATGQHASVVRLHDGHYEYLELQSSSDNGWHLLHDARLYDRFGCDLNNRDYPNFLIDIDSLASSNEFLDLLGYINTAEANQRKGDLGHVR